MFDPIDDRDLGMARSIRKMNDAGMTAAQIADQLHITVAQARAALVAAAALVDGQHDNFPPCPPFCVADHAGRADHELAEGSREHIGQSVEVAVNDLERGTVEVVRFDPIGGHGPVQVLIVAELAATPAAARQYAAAVLHAAELAERAVAA